MEVRDDDNSLSNLRWLRPTSQVPISRQIHVFSLASRCELAEYTLKSSGCDHVTKRPIIAFTPPMFIG